MKRLMKDFRECQVDPLPTVVGRPLNDTNLLCVQLSPFYIAQWLALHSEWHCNILGLPGTPYDGLPIHLILRFPNDYPISGTAISQSRWILVVLQVRKFNCARRSRTGTCSMNSA